MTIPNQSVLSLLFRSPTEELPTTPALIDADDPESHYLSLTTYRLYSQRIAAGLKNHGLKPEDRLLLFSGNNLYFPAVLMGTVMAGCIFTGANPTYTARELAYQVRV
jgi:4-coumarate--CoA ligase